MASFLEGPASSSTTDDGPPPSNKRRVDAGQTAHLTVPTIGRQVSGESDSHSSTSEGNSNSPATISNVSTVATTPSPPDGGIGSHGLGSFSQRGADPFGYLDDNKTNMTSAPLSIMQSAFAPPSMLRSWGSSTNTLFGNQALPASQAEPIHPHVFVTFGSGMRQKEIDTFTAQNKIEARYAMGAGEGIPYHVPL